MHLFPLVPADRGFAVRQASFQLDWLWQGDNEPKPKDRFAVGQCLSGPLHHSERQQKDQTMNGQQLEMSFEQSIHLRRVTRRQRRMTRARWWFTQMRQVVDRAWDWEPVPPAKPDSEK